MTPSAGSRPRALDARALDVSPARLRLTSQLRDWLAVAWRRLPGARALPAGLRAQLAFQRGERVLSVRRGPAGDHALVASDRALYHRSAGLLWSRLGWEQIIRVSWDAGAGQLIISGLDGLVPWRTAVRVRDRGTVPELAQERITHTRLVRWHLRLAGNHSVLVEVRRRLGTGELVWAVISASGGLDSLGADATASVARAVAGLGEHLGVREPPSGDWPNVQPTARSRAGLGSCPRLEGIDRSHTTPGPESTAQG